MAEVKLGRFEAEEGELPPLCLRCGAPAALFKAKRLSWQPTWTFLAFGLTVWPLLLVTMMIRKRMRALLPFCAKHKSYWARESAKVKGVIGSLFILFVIGFILIIETEASGLHTVHPLVLFWLAGPAIMIAVLCLRHLRNGNRRRQHHLGRGRRGVRPRMAGGEKSSVLSTLRPRGKAGGPPGKVCAMESE